MGDVKKGEGIWRRLFGGLGADPRERLLAILEEQAREETAEAAGLRADADRLTQFPDKRRRILEIAEREAEHGQLLREQLRAFGGTVAEPSPPPRDEFSLWQRLVNALEAERADLDAFLHAAYAANDAYPEVNALFLRLREEEEHNHRDLMDLLAKTDSYSLR